MDNRETIMDVALELFYSKGYNAVGVQEIAEKAGITKPTLYYYFGSKRGLLESILERGFRQMREAVTAAAADGLDLPDSLYRVARGFFDFAGSHRKLYLLMLSIFYSARDNEAYQTVAPFIEAHYLQMVQFFDDASDELGNMNGRQEQFAIGFIGFLNHFIMMVGYSVKDDEEIEISDEQTFALVKQFLYGIYS